MAFFLYIVWLILLSHRDGRVDAQNLKQCDLLLTPMNETQDGREYWGLDLQIPPNMCLICSNPKCDSEKGTNCSLWSEIEKIPLYNNILEFGLFESFYPVEGIILIHINDNCYFRIEIHSPFNQANYTIIIKECFSSNEKCESRNETLPYSVIESSRRCLYVGLAFHDSQKVYTAFSSDCMKIAARNFEESKFFMIEHPQCYFDNVKHKPNVYYLFSQPKDRHYYGIPVIVPCSPGGSVVDAQSGRFLEGKLCKFLFFNGASGINFLIKKVFGDNEDLFFPQKNYDGRALRIPIYMDGDKAKSRLMMAPQKFTNEKKVGKIRGQCDYIKEVKVNFPTQFHQVKKSSHELGLSETTTKRAIILGGSRKERYIRNSTNKNRNIRNSNIKNEKMRNSSNKNEKLIPVKVTDELSLTEEVKNSGYHVSANQFVVEVFFGILSTYFRKIWNFY
ncbi:UNVERIFIED_CONTAM: hypothetical protein RMT77_013877 [Armadillidium vulgare]